MVNSYCIFKWQSIEAVIKALSHFSIPAVIELQRLKTKEFTFGVSKKCGINLKEMKNRVSKVGRFTSIQGCLEGGWIEILKNMYQICFHHIRNDGVAAWKVGSEVTCWGYPHELVDEQGATPEPDLLLGSTLKQYPLEQVREGGSLSEKESSAHHKPQKHTKSIIAVICRYPVWVFRDNHNWLQRCSLWELQPEHGDCSSCQKR